ncbi:hypothetical protein JEQ12_016972 [Ovis aries]|uniref:Uncharacterized protein n=1 Tax=Ovis aries TaxID=9940 RepID=A0A836D396_SHEEP|nr:hypothetical protein JEQ12_016972 [Ovis aries]
MQACHPVLRHSAPQPPSGGQRQVLRPREKHNGNTSLGGRENHMRPARQNTPLLHSTETPGTKIQVSRLGKGLLRWGEHDRNADLGLRRHRAGKEWFVPISWNDQRRDRRRDSNLAGQGPKDRLRGSVALEEELWAWKREPQVSFLALLPVNSVTSAQEAPSPF